MGEGGAITKEMTLTEEDKMISEKITTEVEFIGGRIRATFHRIAGSSAEIIQDILIRIQTVT
jgi:hypothetical protein